jgi:hypothetical protein
MIIAIRRDPSQFEYIPSSSAPAVLSCRGTQQPPRQLAATVLMAQAKAIDENNNSDTDTDTEGVILSTTALGLQRLEGTSDSYCPGTLPPRLYQTNPFSRQIDDAETSDNTFELTAQIMPPTAQEIQSMAEQEEDERALSQAIETMVATTRAGRKRKATEKVKDNTEQAKASRKQGGKRVRKV